MLLIKLNKNGNRSCLWRSDGTASEGGQTKSINRASLLFVPQQASEFGKKKKGGAGEEGSERRRRRSLSVESSSKRATKIRGGEKVRELDREGDILGVSGTQDLHYLRSSSWTIRTISARLARLMDTLC